MNDGTDADGTEHAGHAIGHLRVDRVCIRVRFDGHGGEPQEDARGDNDRALQLALPFRMVSQQAARAPPGEELSAVTTLSRTVAACDRSVDTTPLFRHAMHRALVHRDVLVPSHEKDVDATDRLVLVVWTAERRRAAGRC